MRQHIFTTAAFSVLLFSAALTHGESSPTTSSATTTFEGFHTVVPTGWTNATPDRSKTKAMFLLNPNPNAAVKFEPDALIKVDAGASALPTAEETAKKFAGTDGKIDPTTFDIDGEKSYHVTTPSKSLVRPCEAFFVIHSNKLYMIAGGVKDPTHQIHDQLQQVIKSWKWAAE